MRGRKPKSVEQRRREGNPGHRALPEVLLVAGRPDLQAFATPPRHLPRHAKAFWREYITQLAQSGLIDLVDGPALEGLAIMYARARQTGEVVEREGVVGYGSQGQRVQHPALRAERESWKRFYSMAENYALTPMARTRLGLQELNRKKLADEMTDALGAPDLKVVDAEAEAVEA